MMVGGHVASGALLQTVAYY